MKAYWQPLALTLTLSAAGLAHAAEPLRIAVAGPFTGPVTQYGAMVKEGVDTAVERINAEGGVQGRLLEVVTVDDGCEPKQAPVAANRIVNDGIGFVVGHVCSGATLAATNVYEEEGILMVSPSATAPAVTDGKNYTMVFRTIGRDDQQGPAAARYLLQQLKPEKVAILHDKQSYGQGIAAAVRDGLAQGGIQVVMFEGINAGDSDYSAILTKLRAAAPDLIYFGGYHPEMGLLLRQGREQGLQARFMGPEGVGNTDINAIGGDAVEGMLLTLPADFTRSAGNAELVEAFKSKGRNPGGAFQMTAYAATLAVAEGIRGAGTDDPVKVAAWLHANSVPSPIGELRWNAQGDLTDFQFDVYTWHKDGSSTPVQP